MEKKQSSVDWLEQQFNAIREQGNIEIEDLIWQAKAMEKNQHEETWIAALDFSIKKVKGFNYRQLIDAFKKHYNETFGGNNE